MSVEKDMTAACKKRREDIIHDQAVPPCKGKLRLTNEYLQSGSRAEIIADASDGCRAGCKCLDPRSDITRETIDGQQVEFIESICQEKNTGTDPNSHSFGAQIDRD